MRTIVTKQFASAIRRCGALVSRRTTIPILGCVLIAAKGEQVIVRSTDLDSFMEIAVQSGPGDNWEMVIPLSAIAKLMPRMSDVKTIRIGRAAGQKPDDLDKLRIEWGTNENRKTIVDAFGPVSDFPKPLMEHGTGGRIRLPVGTLGRAKRAFGFISAEEARYYLRGICLDCSKDDHWLVATDGRRLAALPVDDTADTAVIKGETLILPTNPVRILIREIGDNASTIWLNEPPFEEGRKVQRTNHGIASVQHGDMALQFKMIDGTYPDWRLAVDSAVKETVTPEDGENELKLEVSWAGKRSILIAALDKLNAFGEGQAGVKMTPQPNGILLISKKCSQSGTLAIKVPVEFLGSWNSEWGANGKLFRQVLADLMVGEDITAKAKDNRSPMVLQSQGDDALGLLMPMRV